MFNLFKRKQKNNCDHEWYKAIERDEFEDDWRGYDTTMKKFVYIYCPKCDRRKKIYKFEWEVIEKEQEIKNNYQRQNT